MNLRAALRRPHALVLLLCTVMSAAWSDDAARLDREYPQTTLEIATPNARLHKFRVWVADNDTRRMQGLMFVKELADNQGMLFVYPAAQIGSMWMKNTFIPLDMIFIRADGSVDSVVANTKPHSLTTISSKGPVLAVLELKGGTAQRLGIQVGARVQHALFKGRSAS